MPPAHALTAALLLELPNINEIKYPQLRVVDSDGKQLGVLERLEALEIASKENLIWF